MNFNIFSLCFLLILFTSCTSNKYKDIPTFTVSNKNFENAITIDGLVESVRTAVANCPRTVQGVINYIVEDGTKVHKGDIVCKIEDTDLQKEYDDSKYALENLIAEFNKNRANWDLQYAILDAQVENNNANTKIAQLDSLQLIYVPQNIRKIKELELEKALIQKQQFDKKLDALNIINKTEIRRWELRIQRLKNRIETLKSRLDDLNIKAPADGMAMIAISRATGDKHIVGNPVWGNMPLVIIPELSEMKVKIGANETEYKLISVGDSVVYTFDAIPGDTAWGKIKMKPHAGAPIKRNSIVKVFEIEATIDSALSVPSPGFSAKCRIIVKESKNALIAPLVSVFDEDSIKVVYVKNKKGFEMRQITTGFSSSKELIVTSGLRENDVIALIKPTQSLINNKVLLIKNDSIIIDEKNEYRKNAR